MTKDDDFRSPHSPPSVAELSRWLVNQMARATEDSTSMNLDNSDAAEAIGQCAELLSRFWPSDEAASDAASTSGSIDTDHSGPTDFSHVTRIIPAGRLGRFEIRSALGHGGFGVVFLVFDPRLNREAALKVPRPEVLMSPTLRQRFLREAQAAAILDHPNIVPIYETGEIGPLGFILSAYCKGPTLATWFREQSEFVPPRIASEIVATLADAVHHAHSRGILHRDLKPANVLLEPSAESFSKSFPFSLRLSDFGLAKRLDDTNHETYHGAVVGTPQYMAPEQAAGEFREVGVLSDVYSLGVILYELLVGEPPFVGHNDGETLHMIQTQELSPTALRRRNVPRDLETICLKCLQKNPAARYQSASELAADLRRFLAGEAVLARPIDVGKRFVRWCRRNPAVTALAAGVIIALVCGTSVSTYYALAAGARAREAQSALAQARKAVDDSFTVLSEQTLLNEPGMQPLRRELLRTALKYYQDFVHDHANDQSLQSELAHASVRAADIHATIGEHSEAESLYRKAIAIRNSLVREDPASTDRLRDLADSWNNLAIWQNINRRGVETEPLFLKVIEIREKLAKQQPTNARDQNDLAVSFHGLANLYSVIRGWAEAETPLRKGIEIRERLVLEYPTVLSYQSDLAASYHTLAASRSDTGHRIEAEQFFRKAIEIREKLVQQNPVADFQRELAQSCRLLADLQTAAGEHPEAASLFDKARAIHEKLARENPTAIRPQRDLAACYHGMAKLQAATNHKSEAETSFHKAIAMQERIIKIDPSIAGYQNQLAAYCKDFMILLNHEGRMDEARKWYVKYKNAWEIIVREEPTNRKYWFHLALSCLWGAENPMTREGNGEAEALYSRAIELLERLAPENPNNHAMQAQLAEAHEGHALLLARSRPMADILDGYRRAIGELEASDDDESRQSHFALAVLHARFALQLALAGNGNDTFDGKIRQASALAPHNIAIQLLCADALALTGAWREAAELHADAAETSGRDWWIMLRRPRLLLAAGDQAGYRAACAQLMDVHGPTANTRQGCSIAATCVLEDRALENMAPVVELAQRCAKAEPDDPTTMAVLGSTFYRAGRLEEAIEVLERALFLSGDPIRMAVDRHDEFRLSRLSAAKFLVLSYRDLGKTDKLPAILADIRRQMDEIEQLEVPSSSCSAFPWSFRVAVEFARRELANVTHNESYLQSR